MAAVLCATLAGLSCGGPPPEPMLTFFNGRLGLSVSYPASWETQQAEQDGVWYRYFLAPPSGTGTKPAVAVTLLSGSLEGTLSEYADVYLVGNTLTSSRKEDRTGATGHSYQFDSADGSRRHSLLLLREDQRVYGLYAQGEAPLFERHLPRLEEMFGSLTLERPASYPLERNDRFGLSLRMPPSWRASRSFSGGDRLLMQFTSPALAAEDDGRTVHAALTVTVESLPEGGDLESFYTSARERLGPAFDVWRHEPWGDGYRDLMHAETSMAASREKRFYRVSGGRGYTLSFVARDDVFHLVSTWFDMIAGTLKAGAEVTE
jgi:hypothetical protein